MNSLRTIIVEDIPANANRLRDMLSSYCSEVLVIGVAENVKEAIGLIKKNKPDLIFLDIELPDGTGFDILDSFRPLPFKVIFFTGHQEYAYYAFRFHAVDFLLKPVKISELVDAVNQVLSLEHNEQYLQKLDIAQKQILDKDKIILHETGGFKVIDTDSIIKLEANGNYTVLSLTNNNKINHCKTLKEFEALLTPQDNFIRVHRSHIINLKHINSYSTQGIITLTEGVTAFLGDSYKNEFLSKFK